MNLKIISLISISLLVLIPIIKSTGITDGELVITSNKMKINQSETLILNIYLMGVGQVKLGFFTGATDDYSKISQMKVGGFSNYYTFNFTNESSSFLMLPVVPITMLSPDFPDYKNLWKAYGKEIPIKLIVNTSCNIPYGDHDITITYFYQDNNSDWQHVSKVFTFHVNTWTESYEELIFIFGSIIIPSILVIVGVYLASYLHLKKKEIKENNEKNINNKDIKK